MRKITAKLVVTTPTEGAPDMRAAALAFGPRNLLAAARACHRAGPGARVLLSAAGGEVDVTLPVADALSSNRNGVSMRQIRYSTSPESLAANAAEHIRIENGGARPHFRPE